MTEYSYEEESHKSWLTFLQLYALHILLLLSKIYIVLQNIIREITVLSFICHIVFQAGEYRVFQKAGPNLKCLML